MSFDYIKFGDFQPAEELLRAALADAERMGLDGIVAHALQNLGLTLALLGRLDEARVVEEASVAAYHRMGNLHMEPLSRSYLARILLAAGDAEAAMREALAASEACRSAPGLHADSLAMLAWTLLALGRTGDALATARNAYTMLTEFGADEHESLIRLVFAEALAASGDWPEALAVIASARDSLLARAAEIVDPMRRERFLRDIPENSRTLELAHRWTGAATVVPRISCTQ